jgi:hypothetical protein
MGACRMGACRKNGRKLCRKESFELRFTKKLNVQKQIKKHGFTKE